MIVPPWCIQVARRKGSFHRPLLLRAIKDPKWENWTPLVVVGQYSTVLVVVTSASETDLRIVASIEQRGRYFLLFR